jgi:hypothetical protein
LRPSAFVNPRRIGFDAFYCMPGIEGAHEKGGVEHEGGRFRRTHLVPVPEVDTLAELNERIAAIDKAEDNRHVHGSNTSIWFAFTAEQDLLAALPDDEFDCGVTLTPTVRRDSRIVVRQCYYSVPARFIGQQIRVSLRANELLVFDRNRVVARHPRLTRRYHYRDDLDHYLEILLVRPGALAGSAGLAQAREAGTFTATHDAFWAAARAAHGDAAGTRALIEVLLTRNPSSGPPPQSRFWKGSPRTRNPPTSVKPKLRRNSSRSSRWPGRGRRACAARRRYGCRWPVVGRVRRPAATPYRAVVAGSAGRTHQRR